MKKIGFLPRAAVIVGSAIMAFSPMTQAFAQDVEDFENYRLEYNFYQKKIANRVEVSQAAPFMMLSQSHQITVYNKGEVITTDSSYASLRDLFASNQIEIKDTDVLYPALDTPIEDVDTVTIQGIEEGVLYNSVEIPFETIEQPTDELFIGETEVVVEGSVGSRKVVIRQNIVNGVVASEEVAYEYVEVAPVNRVIRVGTKEVPEPEPEVVVPEYQGREIQVSATAYSYNEPGLSFFTRNGTDLRVNPYVIAVDPNVIPLGTRVYVPGYGERIAADTGGAIIGNKIDIHMISVDECNAFGRQNMTITILD